MANILTDILKPSVVTKIVSRIRTPAYPLANWFGVNLGGTNTQQLPFPLPTYTYDIFDNTRRLAMGRGRYVSAGTVAARPVGNNTVTIMRFAQKLPLDYNRVSQMRQIGENAGKIDAMGKRYIEKQAEQQTLMQTSVREYAIGSLLRGGHMYFHQSGDDLYPSYTSSGNLFDVDLKMESDWELIGGSFAAGLAMGTGANTITHTWATASNDIPLMLEKVSYGFQSSVGQPLTDVWCNYTVWLNVLQNDKVRQLAGTANTPFAQFDLEEAKAADGSPTGLQIGRIKGLPWIRWHMTPHVLDVWDGSAWTATKVIPDDYCLFTIDKGDWLVGIEGAEYVKDNDLAPATLRQGLYAWIMEKADPARFEMHSIQNFTLELNTPKAVAVARVQ